MPHDEDENSPSAEARLELMKHVERSVRPVCASRKQKMQMRTELLTRLMSLYEQEFARLGDDRAAIRQSTEQAGSPAALSAQFQGAVPRPTYWKCRLAETFFGRAEEPALRRAARVAASVVLILALGSAIRPLFVLAGLVPEEFRFSWSGAGEEMIVKSGGAFVVVLFLHLEKRLIQARRRGLAVAFALATGLVVFSAGLLSFGPTHVFSTSALTDEAVIAWLGLILVPAIVLGVITQLETVWRQDGEWAMVPIE
jgi:hypothetical protein